MAFSVPNRADVLPDLTLTNAADGTLLSADDGDGRFGKGLIVFVNINQLPTAPVQAAPSTATTGGTLAAATYYYKVTALFGANESLPSNEQSQITTGTTSTVTVNWAAVPGATGYKIYRGTAAGAENIFYTVGAVTTFLDTGAAGTAGSVPAGATPSLTITVQGKDEISGNYYNILTSAALTAAGMTVMKIYPDLPAVANLVAQDYVPTVFRIQALVAGQGGIPSATVSGLPIE